MNTLRIGLVSISDRASSGVYRDKGIPALEEWLARALTTPFELQTRLIPDEQAIIEQTLCELVDEMGCHLVLTTGGTGPARRDVTPDATLAIADREMPGFGEQMRQVSPTLCADGYPFPAGRCDPQAGADPQPSRATESNSGDSGRGERC